MLSKSHQLKQIGGSVDNLLKFSSFRKDLPSLTSGVHKENF